MKIIKPQKTLAVKQMAAAYRMQMAVTDNRRSFIFDDLGRPAVLWKVDRPKREFAILALISALAPIHTYFVSGVITTVITAGLYLILISACVILARNAHQFSKKIYHKARNKAFYHEPEYLWIRQYPTTGERGELITALLAARKAFYMLDKHTSLPIGAPEKESMFSRLLKGVLASSENDVDDYLYHEINYLCDTAKKYSEMYEPLIALGIKESRHHH